MNHCVGSKGQVVIPKKLRERVGLHPGTEIAFSLDGDRLVLTPAAAPAADLRSLGGRYRHSDMAARLLEDRASEPR